jgi:hypothetical protein
MKKNKIVEQIQEAAQLVAIETKNYNLDQPDKSFTCPKCKKTKPLTTEHFHLRLNKDGSLPSKSYDRYCKLCYKEYWNSLPSHQKKPKEAKKPKKKVAKIPKKTENKKIAKVELGIADKQIAIANKVSKDIQAEQEHKEPKGKVKTTPDTKHAGQVAFTNPLFLTNIKDEVKQVIKVQSHYIIKEV